MKFSSLPAGKKPANAGERPIRVHNTCRLPSRRGCYKLSYKPPFLIQIPAHAPRNADQDKPAKRGLQRRMKFSKRQYFKKKGFAAHFLLRLDFICIQDFNIYSSIIISNSLSFFISKDNILIIILGTSAFFSIPFGKLCVSFSPHC